MHVLHVINDLGIGGAELMLRRLLQAFGSREFSHEVVSLIEGGVLSDGIREAGIRVHAIGMQRSLQSTHKLLHLTGLVRKIRPDVVQTWMYHSDLLGGLAAKAAGGHARIVWGIHHSDLDSRTSRWTTRATVAICSRLSRLVPDRIVCVSRAARDLHVRAGYAPEKFVVIPNGFDLEEFRIDPAWRHEVRAELGLGAETVVIGLVARVAPQKDHLNFARAAGILARRSPAVRFLLCGEGATPSNATLVRAIREQGVLDRFLLLGRRSDMQRIMNGIDVATLSSSYGEAFPLVIGEAMACGIPCVVTDVGDCAFLVGDAGRVVPPRDPAALARGWEELVRMGRDGRGRLGVAARARIASRFGLQRIAAEYADVYREVLGVPTVGGVSGVPT